MQKVSSLGNIYKYKNSTFYYKHKSKFITLQQVNSTNINIQQFVGYVFLISLITYLCKENGKGLLQVREIRKKAGNFVKRYGKF